jgi:RNA polymerase sigma-70 factor (ECF subfamily)
MVTSDSWQAKERHGDPPARDESGLAAMMAAYQGGDMGAFEFLYRSIAPPLRGYLRALAGDAVLADDLLQETFLQVHRARRTFEAGRPVRPWLYAIAHHVFLMNRRSSSRRARHETLADEDLPEVGVDSGIETLADRHALWRALYQISAGKREALVLYHLVGMSFREVGAVLGISEGAAKVRAHRALDDLRRVLGVSGGSR